MELTRRTFLGRSGLVLAAATAGGLPQLLMPQQALAAGTVTNGIKNPRAFSALTGWNYDAQGGPAPSFTRRTDDGVAVGSTCAQLTWTPSLLQNPRGAIFPNIGQKVPVSPGQVVWGAAHGKIVTAENSAQRQATLRLSIGFYNALGTFITETAVRTLPKTVQGTWYALSGFCVAPATAATCYLSVSVENTSILSTLRATNALLISDAGAAVDYFDGDYPGASWTGTPHASTSTESLPGTVHPARSGFRWGFNDNKTQEDGGQSFTISQDLALHQEIGSGILRLGVDLYGSDVQTVRGDPVNWAAGRPAKWDALYQACVAAGIGFLPVLMSAPAWGATARVQPPADADVADWAALVGQFAQRWSNALALEIWNEPNLKTFWNAPTLDGSRYGRLVKAAYPAIKNVAPNLPVLAGGLSGVIPGGTTSTKMAVDQFLDGMYSAGTAGFYDGLSFHPYPVGPTSGRDFDGVMNSVRTKKESNGDTTPLWITEIGISTFVNQQNPQATVTEAQQAAVNRMLYGMLKRQSDVQAVCFHTLVSDSTYAQTSNDACYEFVERTTMRRKPVFAAVQAEHLTD